MLYEEAHVGSVREAIGILDRFFLEYPINDMAKEAWKLIRANLKEVYTFYDKEDEKNDGTRRAGRS